MTDNLVVNYVSGVNCDVKVNIPSNGNSGSLTMMIDNVLADNVGIYNRILL